MPQILLSLGSNIERAYHLRAAVRALQQHFPPLVLSPVYETAAVGFEGPPFLNLVVAAESELPPEAVIGQLKALEDELGRSREGAKFSSRTIDIDLLTYGDLCSSPPGPAMPRDEILRQAFVLKPLADLAGQQLHPCLKRSYAELWRDFDDKQGLSVVAFDWRGALD